MSGKLNAVKWVVKTIAREGAAELVHDAVEKNKSLEKYPFGYWFWGKSLISAVVAEAVGDYADRKIDETIDWWKGRKKTDANN